MIQANSRPPVETTARVMPVHTVRPGPGIVVVVQSESWVWLPTHWTGRATVACSRSSGCEYCGNQTPLWKGFFVARQHKTEKRALMRITPNAIAHLQDALDARPHKTGLIMHFSRIGKRGNSPMTSTIVTELPDEPKVSWRQTADYVGRVFRQPAGFFLLGADPDLGEGRLKVHYVGPDHSIDQTD